MLICIGNNKVGKMLKVNIRFVIDINVITSNLDTYVYRLG